MKQFLACMCWLLMSAPLYAQYSKASLQSITIDDGLSQGFVAAISQDNQGFLWMGTMDGINRYDGYSFQKFKHQLDDTNSLSGNVVRCALTDRAGRTWVGTSQNGLNLFDREKESWQHISLGLGGNDSKESTSIYQLQEDLEGNLWVKTKAHRLFCIETNPTGSFAVTEVELPGVWVEKESNSYKICPLQNGELLITAFDTLFVLDPRQKPFAVKAFPPFRKFLEKYGSKQLLAIHQDNGGNLWLGDREGMYRFDVEEKQFTHYPLNDLSVGVVNEIHVDQLGQCWVRKGHEVFLISVSKLKDEQETEAQWICSNGRTLYEDRSGIVWIGTIGFGVYKYVPQLQQFRHYFEGNVVYQMLEVGTDSLWLTGRLLNLQHGLDSAYQVLGLLPNELRLVFGTNSIDRQAVVWFTQLQSEETQKQATLRLHQLDLKNKQATFFDHQVDHSFRNSYTFMARDGMIWMISDQLLLRFDPSTALFDRSIAINVERQESGFSRKIYHVYQSRDGLLWAATYDGILQLNPRTGDAKQINQKNGLSNNQVLCLHEDKEGNMWAGTRGGGLNRIDQKTAEITHLLEADGLPNNVVYGILEDEQNHLWLSTNKGLSRMNMQTSSFRNYDTSHGLQSNEFNTNSFLKRQDGTFLFGGMNGITAFSPAEIQANPNLPKVVFTDFRLKNEPVHPGGADSILSKSINATQEVTLKHHQNMISVGFAALEYSIPEKNQYAYRLLGLQEQWIHTDHQRQATFTNLEAGTYTLEVKAANNDGQWSTEVARLQVTVLPPWWQSIWAYAAYLLLAVAAIWGIVHFRVRRERLRNQLLLEEQEANRLRELDQFKQRFFANITHEFRTPIALILGPTSQLLEQMTAAHDRQKLATIFQNGERLLGLVTQLLDLAKLEEGALTKDLRQGDVVAFSRELLRHFEQLASLQQITLRLETHIETPDAYLDFSAFDKILINLLSNALKFSEPGGSVRLIFQQITHEKVSLEVHDNGIGMDEETASHVFERFYQGKKAAHDGTGIGLSLVKELVQFMGGTISVSSRVGEGSVFHLELPIKNKLIAGPSQYNLPPAKAEVPDLAEDQAPENENLVLVVDDNRELQEYIRSCIAAQFVVELAPNGTVALEIAQERIPDIIILDIMMPGMDGVEVLQRLRTFPQTSHIPIIMLTALSSTEARISSFEAGADAYLSKPFHAGELLARLKQIIRSRELLQKKYRYPESIDKPIQDGMSQADHAFLQRVRTCVLDGLDRSSYNTEDLAASMNMSRPHLYRKIKALTDQSISRYMRAIRLAKAREMLEENPLSISEIAYSTGFSSNTYFSQCFKEQYSTSPSAFVQSLRDKGFVQNTE